MIHPALSFFDQGEDAPGFLGTRYLATGGELKSLIDAVNGRFVQTNEEFNAAYQHKKINEQFRHRWATLYASWQDFYLQIDNQTFTTPVAAATAMDEADEYDRQRLLIRDDLKKVAPDDTPGTDTTVTPPKPPEEGTPWYLNLKTVATLVGVGAVAYVAAPPLMAWATRRIASSRAKTADAEELRLPGRRERIGQVEDARVRLVPERGRRQVLELPQTLVHALAVVRKLLVRSVESFLQARRRGRRTRVVAHGFVFSSRSAIFARSSVVSCTFSLICKSLSRDAFASTSRAFFSSSTWPRSFLFSPQSVHEM